MSAVREITRTLCNTTEYVGVFTRDLEPQIKADIEVMLSFALGTIGLSRVAIQVLTKVIPRSTRSVLAILSRSWREITRSRILQTIIL